MRWLGAASIIVGVIGAAILEPWLLVVIVPLSIVVWRTC